MDPAWIVFLAGAVPAVAIALAGAALVGRRALALKKRIDAYERLPVVARIAAANATIAAHAPGAAYTGPLVARVRRAIADIRAARARLEASASTVSSMWHSR